MDLHPLSPLRQQISLAYCPSSTGMMPPGLSLLSLVLSLFHFKFFCIRHCQKHELSPQPRLSKTWMVSQGKYRRTEDIWLFKEAYFDLGTFKRISVFFDGLPKAPIHKDLTSWDVKYHTLTDRLHSSHCTFLDLVLTTCFINYLSFVPSPTWCLHYNGAKFINNVVFPRSHSRFGPRIIMQPLYSNN